MSADSDDEYSPVRAYDSDDSRDGEVRTQHSHRPVTRSTTAAARNTDALIQLVNTRVRELRNLLGPTGQNSVGTNNDERAADENSDKERDTHSAARTPEGDTGATVASSITAVADAATNVTATAALTKSATNINPKNITHAGDNSTGTHFSISPVFSEDAIKINMANTLPLGDALRLIPIFDGEEPSDIYPFINACDTALASVAEGAKPLLLKTLKTKLRGNAFAVTQYREIEDWDSMKKLLEDEFCARRTPAHLQLELNATRQRENETVGTYSARVQKLFHELCNASAMGKSVVEAKIIRDHIKSQTLATFIEGLRQPVKTIIKAGRPTSLEAAIKESLEEERIYQSDRETQRFFQKTKPNGNGNSKYCSHCRTRTHNTNDCRSKGYNFANKATTGPTSSYTVKKEAPDTTGGDRRNKLFCRYCKKPGHDISDCRTKKKRDGQSSSSGNEERPTVKSERTVRDLKLTATTSRSDQ